MNHPIRLTVCALVLSVSRLSAATLYVSLESTNPAPPYTNWATAANVIQDAVDAAGAGDEVVVTNGIYTTGVRAAISNDALNQVVVDKPLVVRSVNGPGVTTISPTNATRCVFLASNAILSGFTLTNGRAFSLAPLPFIVYLAGIGGGARGGTLTNCTLTGNSALADEFGGAGSGGGAAYSTLNNCTLIGNQADPPRIEHGAGFGGGACGSVLNNCTLAFNTAGGGGGAVSSTLNNCTLTLNTAAFPQGFPLSAGGGASGCTLNNCIVYANTSYMIDNPSPRKDDAARCTLNYCCCGTSDSLGTGAGNITNAPLFIDSAGGNFRLQPSSPCIAAGHIAYAPGPVDLDGNPRIVDGTVDMGAYEFQGQSYGPPVLVIQPTSVTSEPGTTVRFSVEAGGSKPLSFQWLRDGLPLADGGNRAGTATPVLTLTSVVSADAGGYSVVVSNQYGSVTSAVALLTVNGYLATLDTGFNPGADSFVYSLALQADGKILAGGQFTTLGGQICIHIGRLNADGTVDTSFNPGADRFVEALALQADGKILAGGDFATLGGQIRNYIGRLNADGTVDTSFNPGADEWVYSLALQADGRILVGGNFSTLGGQSGNVIGRLNADGTLDTSFNPAANNSVYSLALQADGKILVGGHFTTLGGQSRSWIGRLNADGTVDATFNPGANALVESLALQADGKILVGGYFTTLGGQSRNYLGRLNADGTLDTSFNPGANGDVDALALQADGKILVGGTFTTLGGQSRNYLGRLNADGTLDTSFTPGANRQVCSLALQADGTILVGGTFTTLGGQTRNFLGRLSNTEPATQSLTFDGSAVTWLRGGASPEVWRTTFDFSANGTDWASLGAGARTAGGWFLAGVSLPSANGTIRARGYVTGGQYQGSAWFVESDLVVSTPPVILVNDPSFGFSSNRFGFNLSGSAGQVVIVQASANLTSWTPVATNTLGAAPAYFSEPQWTNHPARFYRLRCP